jgi:GPI mannosyltransferase 3
MLAASAAVDLAMGLAPYGWIAENFRQNIVRDRATEFGTAGPLAYLIEIWAQWRVATVPLVLFAAIGARRHPGLAAAAIVNLLLHSLIAHKEYRFIFLTVELVVLLAALGSVDYARRALPRWSAAAIAALTLGSWGAASLALALAVSDWRPNSAGNELATLAGRDPALCGMAYQDMGYHRIGGYAYLHRDIPIYLPVWQNKDGSIGFSPAGAPAWNTLFALRHSPVPAGYAALACRGTICLYRRPGGCAENDAARATRLQTALLRDDY